MSTAVFWECERIVLIDYKEKMVNITGEYYAGILGRLKEASNTKDGENSHRCDVMHDNAPVLFTART